MPDLPQRLRDLAERLSPEDAATCLDAAEVLDRLPVTADGVPIVTGMEVWTYDEFCVEEIQSHNVYSIENANASHRLGRPLEMTSHNPLTDPQVGDPPVRATIGGAQVTREVVFVDQSGIYYTDSIRANVQCCEAVTWQDWCRDSK